MASRSNALAPIKAAGAKPTSTGARTRTSTSGAVQKARSAAMVASDTEVKTPTKPVTSSEEGHPSKPVKAAKQGKPAKASKPSKEDRPAKVSKPTKAAKPDRSDKDAKGEKPIRKDRLIRDSFTMPESDFKLISAVKQRAVGFQRAVKKSEVLRAGLRALQGLSEAQLRALLETLPVIKTGRPKKAG